MTPYETDPKAFNKALAQKLQALKKTRPSPLASEVNQGYKGTGIKAHRRQIWIRTPKGLFDLWLNSGFLEFGGVVNPRALQAKLTYGEKTPDQVFELIAAHIEGWLTTSIDNPA